MLPGGRHPLFPMSLHMSTLGARFTVYVRLLSFFHGDPMLLAAMLTVIVSTVTTWVVEHIVRKTSRWLLRTLVRRFPIG